MNENNILDENRQKIYELCKTYLSGEWTQINEDDLQIDKLSDGNINQLYVCGLPENGNKNCNKVVIRFDAQALEGVKSNTHVLAMNMILSAKNIAPKLVGAFNGGIISQYIEGRYFNNEDDQDQVKTSLLATKLAQLHSTKIPTPRNTIMSLYKYDNPFVGPLLKNYQEIVRAHLQKSDYEFLSKFDFIGEYDWVMKVIDGLQSPVVFSHNDFNKKNILVKDSKQLEIFLIDFDWSSYNYRGIDLGQYFSSWGQIDPDFGFGDFPSDEQMSVFIEAYIKEMCKIFGDSFAEQEINSKETLIKEAKIFAFLAYMKDFLYFIWQFLTDNDIMAKGETRMKCFGMLKEKMLHEYDLKI